MTPPVPGSSRSKLSRQRRHAGLSLIEMMLALSITAMLLTATMVALDASFKAYASAAEEASTQTQTRMVTQRLITLIRTSTAQGPLLTHYDPDPQPCNYLAMIDSKGNGMTIGYKASTRKGHPEDGELWYVDRAIASASFTFDKPDDAHALLSGVTSAQFFTRSRLDGSTWVLERATVQMSVVPPPDATLALERKTDLAFKIVASTVPRRLD